MIDIDQLSPEDDVGRWVKYTNSVGEIERGRVKSWNDERVFVVYHCRHKWQEFMNYTAVATNPNDLVFMEWDAEELAAFNGELEVLFDAHCAGKCGRVDCLYCNEDWSWFQSAYENGATLILDSSCGTKAYGAVPCPGLYHGYLHCSQRRFMNMPSLEFDFRANTIMEFRIKKAKEDMADTVQSIIEKLRGCKNTQI